MDILILLYEQSTVRLKLSLLVLLFKGLNYSSTSTKPWDVLKVIYWSESPVDEEIVDLFGLNVKFLHHK